MGDPRSRQCLSSLLHNTHVTYLPLHALLFVFMSPLPCGTNDHLRELRQVTQHCRTCISSLNLQPPTFYPPPPTSCDANLIDLINRSRAAPPSAQHRNRKRRKIRARTQVTNPRLNRPFPTASSSSALKSRYDNITPSQSDGDFTPQAQHRFPGMTQVLPLPLLSSHENSSRRFCSR